MKRIVQYFMLLLAVLFTVATASAQTNTFPDTSVLYTQVGTGFNTALTWSIGATAVLLVIGWIVRAMRRK